MIDNKNKPELTNLEKSTSSDQNNLVKSTKSDLNNYLYLQNAAQSLTTIQAALPTLVNERTLRRWLTDAVNTGLAIRTGKHRSTKYMANKSIKENEFKFLENKSASQKKAILSQIRDLWTHTSTAIEGNTLSLGDTHFLLEEGLTVSGKAIKEHQEIIGHASAIELI
jgi:Fic family protein